MHQRERGPVHRRGDLRWLLVILGFFVYLLLLTWERVEWRERSSRIEELERTLQQKRTDSALRQVELTQKTSFVAVRQIVRERGMMVADAGRHFLLTVEGWPPADETSRGPFRFVSEWVARTIRGSVAQAQPSETGGGDAENPN